jgi:oxygen-dependent protoporphyrinogen oxidase
MAGMAAAYELARTAGIVVTLFEASHRLGGTVETVTLPSGAGCPFVIECGPDSWVSDKPAARELAIELGLEDQLIYSIDARRRNYLARFGAGNRGQLLPMPDGMRMMVPTRWAPVLESPLFTWQARLAYLREPKRADELKQYAHAHSQDESVRSFVRRHFGDEATETIAGPLLAGVFGGDIDTLSAQAVLAPFVRMEREHGSLITAVMQRTARQQAERSAPEPIFTTLRTGLSTLIERMAETLPTGSVRPGCRVTGLIRGTECAGAESRGPGDAAADSGWRLRIAARDGHSQPGGAERPALSESERFDAVLLATPAHVTRQLLAELDSEAADLLAMDATSAIVVALAYEPEAAAPLRIPRGFGFLVPPSQALNRNPSLLAGTFMDQKFPDRAPAGAVFLRGFFGGEAAPRMMDWPDDQIAQAAREQFSRLLGPLPIASHTVVRRWPRSLPQYAVGHVARMQTLEARIDQIRGLRLTGNAYRGVGLPSLVEHGRAAARALVTRLRTA